MSSTATDQPKQRIEDIDVTTEMQRSYVEYAMSVIHSRALPDARDGLKPVQRRILYMMREMGLSPDKGHVKSARVVGEVMGKLHPHGDSAIYDALVRLSRDFAMEVPLVDGHGNFGSLDDGPAASRYTEARLTAAAMLMTDSLDENVVDFVPNYDNQLQQPSVLPSPFPNLLINGTSGIAVGMATNMAPHNPREAIAAAVHLLRHPHATVDDLMRLLPGPDLPSGGSIVGLDGVHDAYERGRGIFTMRAKASIERVSPRRQGIVITELPYMVGPESVIQKIKDGVTAKKLQGISNVHDLTDRNNGLRLIIDVKNGFSPEAVLSSLYRHTPLETNFGINNVVLVDGRPRTVGLVELLSVYNAHRIEVVRRRSQHRLDRAQERLHLVEGLLIAIVDIDEVIALIRSSDDTETARGRLMSVFDLSQPQADYILELRLRRLTKFSQIELESERDDLRRRIKTLTELLGSERRLRDQVARELDEVAEALSQPRRTVLLTEDARTVAADVPLEIPDEPCAVLLGANGRLVRQSIDEAQTAERAPADGQPTRVEAPPALQVGDQLDTGRRRRSDGLAASIQTTTRAELGVVTDHGRMLRASVLGIPAGAPGLVQFSGGVHPETLVSLDDGERVVTVVSLDDPRPLAVGTSSGVVKRVQHDVPDKPDWEVIALKKGDRIVGAAPAADDDELVFVSRQAQLLHYPASSVRPQGRSAQGMAGMRLGADDEIVWFGVVPKAALSAGQVAVLTIANDSTAFADIVPGSAKISPFSEFPAKGRGTGGVRAQRMLKGEDQLARAWVGAGAPLASGVKGIAVELPSTLVRRDASGEVLAAPVLTVGGRC
ncbi:DNA gyrase/topoisomerase IV subunit A [Pseudoclavibacter sp. 13-3]|uniref:DNA gyrase/topoisomerase IV subunit A n=1 Tax=Pseudoclavibacter sp. 13-3 TaxID=2901228 RepID=UPI001E542DEA|nr:DNA topoisomerase IV subunit A [Pseudoclavibacter sp. 13-3]MCD7100496.1 DNA topoisomerase IV subunit A [Pseudoclavibacter sp. 13-3]